MLDRTNLSFVRCPKCYASSSFINHKVLVQCEACMSSFFSDLNYIDFVKDEELDNVSQESLQTWGRDLHSENKSNKDYEISHLEIMNDRLGKYFSHLSGDVIEVGFGTGRDLIKLSESDKINNLVGIDIGNNARALALQFKDNKNIFILRADAQTIPIKDQQFDALYSYGVIHHTKNPYASLLECRRILKRSAFAFIYIYSSHSNNLFKRLGVMAERILMLIMSSLPYKIKILICYLVTPIAWTLFTVPSRLFRLIGLVELASKMPMNWGITPYSILPDIKDRLLAPVNHRYSIERFKSMLCQTGFKPVKVLEDPTGLYCVAKAV